MLQTCPHCFRNVLFISQSCPACGLTSNDVQRASASKAAKPEPQKIAATAKSVRNSRARAHSRQLILGAFAGGLLLFVGVHFGHAKLDSNEPITSSWGNIVSVAGIILLALFVGSIASSAITGKEEFGTSTVTYRCSRCGREISFHAIPNEKGSTITCPGCGTMLCR